jgi:integrase
MKGHIRTMERCRKCGKPYTYRKNMGLWCLDCLTHPQKFYIDIFIDGKRHRIFIDKHGKALTSYRAAEDMLAVLNQDIENKKSNADQYKLSEYQKYKLNNFIDLYVSQKEKSNLSPSHLKELRHNTEVFSKFFWGWDIRNIKTAEIARFKNSLTQKPSSQRVIMTYIHGVFSEALRMELIDRMPVFPKIAVDETNWTWIDSDAQMEVMKHIPQEDYEVFKFLILHGCRIAEARALKVKDLDIKNHSVKIQRTYSLNELRETTKQKKINLIPLHPDCLDYLKEVVSRSLPEAFVYPNPRTGRPYGKNTLREQWYSACRKAGLSQVQLKDATRHSLASQLVNDNTSLYTVSKLLGHSSVKMTQRYAHIDLESQRVALHKLSVNRHLTSIEKKEKVVK